jgi:hypothetical protein
MFKAGMMPVPNLIREGLVCHDLIDMLAMIRVLKLFIVLMFMVPLCYSFQPKVTKNSFGADQTEFERREQNFYFPLDFLLN